MRFRKSVLLVTCLGCLALLAGCQRTAPELIESGLDKMRKGDNAAARADFDAAVQLQPTNTGALFWRARMYEIEHEYELALNDYNETLRLDDKNAMAFANRAWIQATAPIDSLRDGHAALVDIQRGIELDDGLTVANKPELAAVYAELGDFPKAIALQQEHVDTPREFLGVVINNDHAKANLALYRAGKPARSPTK